MNFPSSPSLTGTMLDTIWQIGMSSLFSNNNQIVIPLYMVDTLGEQGVLELKSRFSQLFGNAPTTAFKDVANNVMRLCLASDYSSPVATDITYASPSDSASSPQSTASAPVIASDVNAHSSKPAKVPRPPNSFILYRQEHHPKVKAQNPDLHNNDISVILGKQWGMEPQSVKEKYKARASAIKKKHAAENPGYQYAPRKPSEKKRRMTARKMARFQAAAEEQLQGSPTNTIVDLTGSEPFMSNDSLNGGQRLQQSFAAMQPRTIPSGVEALGVQRPQMQGYISGPSDDGEHTVSMPLTHPNFGSYQQQLNDHLAPAQSSGLLPFDSINRETVFADAAQHNVNDQDFLESLIDWEGIQADADMIHQMTANSNAEAEEIYGMLSVEDAAAKFQADLDRLCKLL